MCYKNFRRKLKFSTVEILIVVDMAVFSGVVYGLRAASNRYDPAVWCGVQS